MASEPTFYLSYGMPKSGSTLAFELVRTMLSAAGIKQEKLPYGVVDSKFEINFIRQLNKTALETVSREVSGWQTPVALKTHSRLFPVVRKGLRQGRMIGHAVYRDPRDIALSMMDAARDGRAWGSGPDGPFQAIKETVPLIHKHLGHFLAWSNCPGIEVLRYEQVAFETRRTCERLADQIGISPDLEMVMKIVAEERFTQKNRATPARWRKELTDHESALLGEEFAEFIEEFGLGDPVPESGGPSSVQPGTNQ